MDDEVRLGSVARRLAATRRVLVVEDEVDIADFLRAYFRASGYDIVHLDPDTPLDILEAIDELRPDCLLLDLNLRGFSGAEAYRLLRTDSRYAFVPVLIVSARPDGDQVIRPSSIDAFVAKPFSVDKVAELVSDRIEIAAERRERTADAGLDVLDARGLDARLGEALGIDGSGSVAFALVRLRSMRSIITEVGDAGFGFVVRRLVERARELLPGGTSLALTGRDEVAVVLPGQSAADAEELLTGAVDEIGDRIELPGGAGVDLRLSVGLAAFPEHADDADGLYMAADAALADAVENDEVLAVAL